MGDLTSDQIQVFHFKPFRRELDSVSGRGVGQRTNVSSVKLKRSKAPERRGPQVKRHIEQPRRVVREYLPCADGSIDVVINVESSQSYPDIRAFYCEVLRVLAPDGYFLYSDVLPLQQMAQWIGLLSTIGFELESDRDVTSNVLLSCDDVARRRASVYDRNGDATSTGNFLGAPGSPVYQEMKNGRWTYRILRLRKRLGNRESGPPQKNRF